MSDYNLIALRIAMAIALIGSVLSAFYVCRDDKEFGLFYGIGGAIAGFVGGFFIVISCELILFLAARAFFFVFTGE